jgi:hypothetical protein
MSTLAPTTDTIKFDFKPVIDEETGEEVGHVLAEVDSEVSNGHFVSNESGAWRVGPGDPTASRDLSCSIDEFRRYVAELQQLLAAVEDLAV